MIAIAFVALLIVLLGASIAFCFWEEHRERNSDSIPLATWAAVHGWDDDERGAA